MGEWSRYASVKEARSNVESVADGEDDPRNRLNELENKSNKSANGQGDSLTTCSSRRVDHVASQSGRVGRGEDARNKSMAMKIASELRMKARWVRAGVGVTSTSSRGPITAEMRHNGTTGC